MRIKIGHQWFEVSKTQPIMIELTPKDRENIANMAPDATKYAMFADDTELTPELKLRWMCDDYVC